MSTPEQRIAELEDRIAFLEEQVASHTGLYDSASNTNYPHPNQVIGVSQFLLGSAVIGNHGIQVVMSTSSSGYNPPNQDAGALP